MHRRVDRKTRPGALFGHVAGHLAHFRHRRVAGGGRVPEGLHTTSCGYGTFLLRPPHRVAPER